MNTAIPLLSEYCAILCVSCRMSRAWIEELISYTSKIVTEHFTGWIYSAKTFCWIFHNHGLILWQLKNLKLQNRGIPVKTAVMSYTWHKHWRHSSADGKKYHEEQAFNGSHLNKNAFERCHLAENHWADFDDEVSKLKSLTTRLDTKVLPSSVKTFHLLHQRIEEDVGDEARPGVQYSETWRRLLRVAKNVQWTLRCRCTRQQLWITGIMRVHQSVKVLPIQNIKRNCNGMYIRYKRTSLGQSASFEPLRVQVGSCGLHGRP